jgi:hypothetical protein
MLELSDTYKAVSVSESLLLAVMEPPTLHAIDLCHIELMDLKG